MELQFTPIFLPYKISYFTAIQRHVLPSRSYGHQLAVHADYQPNNKASLWFVKLHTAVLPLPQADVMICPEVNYLPTFSQSE